MTSSTQTQTTATPTTLTLNSHPPAPTPHPHTPIPRGPITAFLNFYNPPLTGEKPYNYVEAPPSGFPQRNYTDTSHSIEIHDLRGRENLYNLSTHAFAAIQPATPSAATRSTFDSDAAIRQIYFPEVEALLLQATAANKVLLFDYTIRLATPGAPRAPVNRVHIDQTAASAAQRPKRR
ncbi:MAG: hypothetical protein L6R40_007423 [Gallowayella cf. fulva]|nr:MAG: hypothetical protein L6R40_007423 [Xanthomendoza cf. fulva]